MSAEALQVMAKTLRGHRTGLLNWYDHPNLVRPAGGDQSQNRHAAKTSVWIPHYEHMKERLLTLYHTKFTLQG